MNLFCWKCGGQIEAHSDPERRGVYICPNPNCKARFMMITLFGNRALAILNE